MKNIFFILLLFGFIYGCNKDSNPVINGNGNTGTNIIFQKAGVLDSLWYWNDTTYYNDCHKYLGNFIIDTNKSYILSYQYNYQSLYTNVFSIRDTSDFIQFYQKSFFPTNGYIIISDTIKAKSLHWNNNNYSNWFYNLHLSPLTNSFLVIKDLYIYVK